MSQLDILMILLILTIQTKGVNFMKIYYLLFIIVSYAIPQNNGDAVYRSGGLGNNQDHAGVYCSDCNDSEEGVYEIKGWWHHVNVYSWNSFIGSNLYLGSYTNPNISYWDISNIFDTLETLDLDNSIWYVAGDMLQYDLFPESWIEPDEITDIRCDGVVEYSYEWNDIEVWGISNTGNEYGTPHHYDVSSAYYVEEHNNLCMENWFDSPEPWIETSPRVQRGAYGTDWTKFESTNEVSGDMNQDGIINVSDLVHLVGLIFGEHYWSEADWNNDDAIDILDVIILVNVILGGGSGDEYPEDTVFINKIIEQRSTPPYVLLLKMINPTVVLGMQMTIQLDPGYKAVDVNRGQYAVNNDMTLAYSISSDSTKIKYLYYGPDGESFPTDGNGTILEIGMIYNGSPRAVFNPEGNSVTEMLVTNSGTSYLESELIDLIRYDGILNGDNTANLLPEKYNLGIAYPNPFNPITTLEYDLPKNGEISLIVYNVLGREVTQLVNTFKEAGYHTVQWDASGYASGTYFVKMNSADFAQTQKIMLVK